MTSDTPSQSARAGWQPWSTVPRDDMDVLARRDDFYQVVFWDTAENTGWHVGDADLRYPDGAFTHWRRDCLSASPPAEALPAGVDAAARSLIERYDAAMACQKDSPDASLIVMANYGDLAINHLRRALTSAPAPEDRS